ncbi:MAG TPA: hypothetical protein VGL20_21790 [Candidatus Dormibacteraeota bacterium]|jgi:hypothetical protein
MRIRHVAPWLLTLAALSGCGTATTPVTSAPTPTPGPRTVVAGEIVAIKGNTATVTTYGGTDPGVDSKFSVDATTTVSEQISADIGLLVPGTCAFATGDRDVRGYVVAVRVVATAHGAAGCVRPGVGRAGSRPGARGTQTTVGGLITGVEAGVFAIRADDGTVDHFTAGAVTPVTRYAQASLDSVHTGACVIARGLLVAGGVLRARSVAVIPAAITGCGAGAASVAAGP